jgi:hypothetical protein
MMGAVVAGGDLGTTFAYLEAEAGSEPHQRWQARAS